MSEYLQKIHEAHKARRAKFFGAQKTINLALVKPAPPEPPPPPPAPAPSVIPSVNASEYEEIISTGLPLSIVRIIQVIVGSHYGFKRSEIISEERTKNMTFARHVAVYLTKEMTKMSLPQIGMKFGRRDHTTILHAIKRIDYLLKCDIGLKNDIDMLKMKIFDKWKNELEVLQKIKI